MSSHPRYFLLAGATVAVLLLVVAVPVLTAGWPGSSGSDEITDGQAILVRSVARQDVDLAATDDGLVVAWASSVVTPGIVFRTRVGSSWQASQLRSQNLPAWAPSIAVGDNGRISVWVTGVDPGAGLGVRSLVSYDTTNGTQPVAAGLYGHISPDLAVNPDGAHLVYAAAETSEGFLSGDLCYAFRPDGTSAWDSPVRVVESTEVIPDTAFGGIFNPQIAIEPGTETIHVVWQQEEIDAVSDNKAIWHISRTREEGGQPKWGDPERVSPLSQRFAVLPSLAIGGAGEVYVSWSELIGDGSLLPEEQHIHYRRLASDSSVVLSSFPIHVNVDMPSWTVSSLSTHGETICVAWHGYEEPQGQYYEEVFFRCSQDKGRSWLQVVQVSDTPDRGSVFPRLVVDQAGRVHIVWVENEGASTFFPRGVFYRTGNPVHGTFLPLVLKSR